MSDLSGELYALVQSDSAFCTFMHTQALDGIWIWNLEQRDQVWANDRVYQILGIDPAVRETNPMVWQDAVFQEDWELAQVHLRRHLEDPNYRYDVVVRYHHTLGHTLWIRCLGYAVRDAEGTPVRFIGVHRDKTDLKRSEQTLLQCNDTAQLGTWEHDFHAEFMRLSPIARAILELPEDLPILPDAMYTFVLHPEEQNRMRQFMLDAVKEGNSFDQEIQLRTYTGREIFVHMVGMPERHQGRCIRLFGTIRDITARKRAEEKIRMSEDFFRAAFEFAPVGMALLGPGGEWVRVNDALCRILGYERTDLFTKTWQELTHPADLNADLALLQEVLNGTRDRYEMEKRYLRKDGELVYALLSVSAVRDKEGHVERFISQVQDITDRVLAQKRLEATNRLLNEAQRIGKMGAWEMDVETGQVLWSDQVYAIHEVEKDGFDLYALDGISFYHPEDQSRVREMLNFAIRDQRPYDLEARFITARGQTLQVRVTCYPIVENGKVVRLSGMFQDITDAENEKRAREREREFSRQIIQNMADGLTILDADGVQVGVNPALCEMTGYTEEELLGHTAPYPYWPEEEHETIRDAFAQALSQQGGQFELTFSRKDGARFPVLLNAAIILDDEGKIRYHFANLTDLTDIHEARKEREDLARFNNLMLESLPGYVFVKDSQFRIVSANQAFLSLYPETMRDQVIGYTTVEAYPEAEREIFLAEDRKALREGSTEIKETVHVPNGEQKTLLTRKIRFEDAAGTPHILGLAIDISALEEARTAVDDLLAQTEAILNSSADVAIIVTDQEGLITFFSSGAQKLLGYSAEEVVGLHKPLLFHVQEEIDKVRSDQSETEGQTASEADLFLRHSRLGHSKNWEWTLVRKDGTTFPVALSMSPILRNGTVVGTVGIALDTTAQKENEARIRQLLDVTRLQNDRLRNFSHIVSHNLRSHVAGIGGLLQILREDEPSLFERELFQLLDGASVNLKSTIEDLTEMVKIHLGSTESARTLPLRDAVQRILVSTFAQRQASGMEVSVDIPPELTVFAIPSYLDSIALNFITNAMKYRAQDRVPSLHIYTQVNESHVTIHFKDNGQGIDLNLYGKHLFGLYKTFHGQEDARGIGLFITRNQVEAMGGTIEVESTPGVGSEFRVVLPLEPR